MMAIMSTIKYTHTHTLTCMPRCINEQNTNMLQLAGEETVLMMCLDSVVGWHTVLGRLLLHCPAEHVCVQYLTMQQHKTRANLTSTVININNMLISFSFI